MQNSEKKPSPYLSFPSVGKKVSRHSHFAMATEFAIYIAAEEAGHAGAVAAEAFKEIDRLEQDLSRFIENSDISRISHLEPGKSIGIGIDTYNCLKQSEKMKELTYGAFNIAFKSYQNNTDWRRESVPLYSLSADGYRVTALKSPVLLDLGGIGKGFAIDKTVDILKEWGIKSALIHGGSSTVYAFGAEWPVSLTEPVSKQKIEDRVLLNNRSLSGSGLEKGAHIIDPRTGIAVEQVRAAWAFAPTATVSDALSTAFMIMNQSEVDELFGSHKELSAVIVMGSGTIQKYNCH